MKNVIGVPGWFPVLGAAFFYGFASLGMNFLNKAVLSPYQFNFPMYLLTVQMVVTIIVLEILRMTGIVLLETYSWSKARKFLPVSLFFLLHCSLSLAALEGMNIPMYGALKRCTPLANLVLSVIVLKKPLPSPLLLSSVVLITTGCLIAGAGDLQFQLKAYMMAALSVVAQAGYLTLVQRDFERDGLSPLTMLHLNAWNTVLPLASLSVLMGEVQPANTALVSSSLEFRLLFTLLAGSGGILMFSTVLCTSLASALTTSLVGVAKSVLQTVIGFQVFGGVPFHVVNVTGLVLNLCGGLLYTFAKHKETRSHPPLPR